ncbi:MAG: transposase [Planctomycetes bacterium]|nr:transposase [Planctomycetota bacterium]MBI3843995.1 transposase [Planctomycetota bacterium]
MARRQRFDVPGSMHHITNRGLARRPIFQSRDDIRFFLACLAQVVRRGEIEIFAYSILTTHFHLFVRCLVEGLARPLGWVLNQYVRRYNRRVRRDGPLFRSRYRSTPVTTDAHRQLVVPYIDQNAVAAGLVTRSIDYPWGSAAHYARKSGPPWLERGRIEADVCEALRLPLYDPARYREAIVDTPDPDVAWLLERRVEHPLVADDPLDDLVLASPERVQEWMARKSLLADSREARVAVAPPALVHRQIAALRLDDPDWSLRPASKAKPSWVTLEVGVLRSLSGLSVSEIRQWVDLGESSVHRALHDHDLLMARDSDYADRAARLASEVVRSMVGKARGAGASSLALPGGE